MEESGIGEVAFDAVLIFASLTPTISPAASLLVLSGDATLIEPKFKSGLTERVAKAWVTPLPELTGSQVRVLVSQRFGLRWLAKPVALFLQQHPRAECDLYTGDLMCAALRAYDDFLRFAPSEMRTVLGADFG